MYLVRYLNTIMNFDSFSHGQIQSKIWLCEHLEPYLTSKTSVTILGCWYNVLAFMLLTRRPHCYEKIIGIDKDVDTITIANKICDAWMIGNNKIVTNVVDSNHTVATEVVINCSSEHFESLDWFSNIKSGTLVCIQSSNVTDTEHPWYIKQVSPTFESFLEKYQLTSVLFSSVLPINYQNWGYDRYMLIGIK